MAVNTQTNNALMAVVYGKKKKKKKKKNRLYDLARGKK